jgi:hypothetical protein
VWIEVNTLRNRRILSITVVLFLLASAFFGMAAIAVAEEPVPVIPASYYGQVFLDSYGGQVVADGATVEVYLEGDTEPRAESRQVQDGWYGQAGLAEKYSVPGTTEDFEKNVIFKVNGIVVETYVDGSKTTVTFKEGDVLQVDLVVPAARLTLVRPADLDAVPYTAEDAVFEWQSDLALDSNAAVTATFSDVTNTIEGTVSFSADGKTVTVKPSTDLRPGTEYTLTVSGLKDSMGNSVTLEPVEFTTAVKLAVLTMIRPENLNAVPYAAADAVFEWQSDLALDPNAAVTATFSDGANIVEGAVYFAADAMSFTVQPVEDLLPGTAYTLVVGGLWDASGNPVNLEPVEFTTAPAGPSALVSGVEPAVVLPGGTVTVSGHNFRSGAKLVIFDVQNRVAGECTVSVIDENTLTCSIPADLAAGLYTINVYNVGDERPVSGAVALTVAAAEVPGLDLLKGSAGSQPATDLKAGDVFRVQVPVTVARNVPNALIVVRLDDPDGKPLLVFMESSLAAGQAVKFGAGFTLPDKPGTYAARAYVWDGWDTMKPVAAAQEISFAVQ